MHINYRTKKEKVHYKVRIFLKIFFCNFCIVFGTYNIVQNAL